MNSLVSREAANLGDITKQYFTEQRNFITLRPPRLRVRLAQNPAH
jgi:hypothetical protein